MGHREKINRPELFDGIQCSGGGHAWGRVNDETLALVGQVCCPREGHVWERVTEMQDSYYDEYVCSCGSTDADIRYRFGYFFDYMCDKCWCEKGYKALETQQFDPSYAGESLDGDYEDVGYYEGDW
jgi:hypothetical protein